MNRASRRVRHYWPRVADVLYPLLFQMSFYVVEEEQRLFFLPLLDTEPDVILLLIDLDVLRRLIRVTEDEHLGIVVIPYDVYHGCLLPECHIRQPLEVVVGGDGVGRRHRNSAHVP